LKKAVGTGRKFPAPAVFGYWLVKESKVLGCAETFEVRADLAVLF